MEAKAKALGEQARLKPRDQLFVIRVRTNPEPDDLVCIANPKRAIIDGDAH